MDSSKKQYLIYLKYTREYLSRVTGYSKGTLTRMASGAKLPSEAFIGVCCHTLKEPQEYLFKLIELPTERLGPPPPPRSNQALIETIDELASRLTNAEAEIKALQKEVRKY